MIDNLGISFSPLNNPTLTGGQGQGAGQPGSVPLADAIRMLSLRIPRVVGARGIAPQMLLNAPGLAGAPADIMTLLKQLFGQFSVAQPTGMLPSMGQGAKASPYASTASAFGLPTEPMPSPAPTSYQAPSYTAPVSTSDQAPSYTAPTPTSYQAPSTYPYPYPSITPGSYGPVSGTSGPIL